MKRPKKPPKKPPLIAARERSELRAILKGKKLARPKTINVGKALGAIKPPKQVRKGTGIGTPFRIRRYSEEGKQRNLDRGATSKRVPGTGRGISAAHRVPLAEQVLGAKSSRAGGIHILLGTVNKVPHTYTDQHGNFCDTDRWFTTCGLCYDVGKDDRARGGQYDPMLFLQGPGFRCYYPGSTAEDFKRIMQSRSAGRWLHAWSQKSAYIEF